MSESEQILEELRPIIAKRGIMPVLMAMADRLEEDSKAILKRHEESTKVTRTMSAKLQLLAMDVKGAVSAYKVT